jgi:hypothetical protein
VASGDVSPSLVSVKERGRLDMEPIKFSLCPEWTECPEVEITEHGVMIGENTNTVRLSHAE